MEKIKIEEFKSLKQEAHENQKKLEDKLQLMRSCITAFSYAYETSENVGREDLYWPDLMEILDGLVPSFELTDEIGRTMRKVETALFGDQLVVKSPEALARRAARTAGAQFSPLGEDANGAYVKDLVSKGMIPVSSLDAVVAAMNAGGN
jgi:hypothetical protein